jgi:glycosyltransferase involved in cell wall biosynthesis
MFHEGENNDGYLLFLGKLEMIKGIYPLLDACRSVSDVPVILAGRVEEPVASELPSRLSSNAQYVGMKHGEELRRLLYNALAVVLPSLWYENQPFSILEAFACGKPVIASDLGGMTELVAHQERGLLVPPSDVETLAKAMHWLATHSAEAREMGKKAYRYVLGNHGPERHYQRLMEAYEQVG